jgi:hypothetical protein
LSANPQNDYSFEIRDKNLPNHHLRKSDVSNALAIATELVQHTIIESEGASGRVAVVVEVFRRHIDTTAQAALNIVSGHYDRVVRN